VLGKPGKIMKLYHGGMELVERPHIISGVHHRTTDSSMTLQEITQENVRLLLPGKIAAIVEKARVDRHCTSKEALLSFYQSELYRELENEKTKRWWESPSQLYADWVEFGVGKGAVYKRC
jgi:hypothetical protein